MSNLRNYCRYISTVKNSFVNFNLIIRDCSSYKSSILASHVKRICTIQNNNALTCKVINFNNYPIIRHISLSKICQAKGKDRGSKEKKKPKASKNLDLREVNELIDVDNLVNSMTQCIEDMKTDFTKNINVRSAGGAIDEIPVKFDGKEYRLQELAQIARKPKIIVLNLSGFPTAIPDVLKAIERSGMNINPQQEGTTIYLPIPKVTKDYRESLSKNAKAIYIKYRDQIKDIRTKAIKSLNKRNDVTVDAIHRGQRQLEALCDKYLREAEMVLEIKQNELRGSTE